LAGEELEDGAGFTRLSGGSACNHKARDEERRRDKASLHSNLRALMTVR
jgi:hypothetical protein